MLRKINDDIRRPDSIWEILAQEGFDEFLTERR